MKKSSTLASHILNQEIKVETDALLHRLNLVIDSMTDDNCQPLPSADAQMVMELKSIAFGLYNLTEEVIPEASDDLIATIEAGW